MGNIGRLTAEKFQVRFTRHSLGGVCKMTHSLCAQNACGCSIIAYDPFAPADIWSAKGTSRAIPHERVATIEDMLSEVDVLSLHLPLTPTTRGMINRPVFARMKRDAVIV